MDPLAPASVDDAAAASSSSAPKLVPFGKYLLLERVAVGGMAEVWLAKRMQGDGVSELLAVKRILPNLSADGEFVKMFVDEARIAGQLQHPGIVPMHELGRIGQTFYIAMEFVWGRDLLQLLRTVKAAGEKISFAAAAYIGARVCEALHYAHVKIDNQGKPLELVHRDVSPQNVLVSFDGKVKLIDFGIAKATSRTTKTQAGTLKGKVGYMSPEQVRGLPIDARSDLFAVGTLLYEMLTVRPLFARGNNFEAMNRVRDADVPPIAGRVPEIPPALAEIVTKALRREASDRYADAQEMQRALTIFLAQHVSSFERYDLATWLRRVYEEDFVREKARLDALDSIGRPAISPVAKKWANPVTSLEIATTSLFDDSQEDATQIADQAPYQSMKPLDGPSEVFFHRDDVVHVGESNPEGHAPRPLKALFRPGKADAVEAYRPPIVARDDNARTQEMQYVPPAAAPAVVPVVPVPVVPVAVVPVAVVSTSKVPPAKVPLAKVPLSKVPMAAARRGTLAPGEPTGSAVPPPARDPARDQPGRPSSLRPMPVSAHRAPMTTAPFGVATTKIASLYSDTTNLDEPPPTRTTMPHHAPASSRPPPDGSQSGGRVPVTPLAGEDTRATQSMDGISIEVSASFSEISSIEVEADLAPVVLKAPTIVRRPIEEEDETFDDGGIREPLVRPGVSRARIVAVSDLPPSVPRGVARRAVANPGPLSDAPTQPGRLGMVPLVGGGDTPSTSAITRALEQMAHEAAVKSTSGSGQLDAVTTDPGRVSGFALDPQQLNSQIIKQILPPGSSASGGDAAKRGEPTESFATSERGGRVGHVPTLMPRATVGDYVFFALAALLTVALGGTAAVAILFADSAAALEVHCIPAVDATVIVDGLPRGRAPVRLEDLAPGSHTITLVAHGYAEAQRQVVIGARESASIEIALTPAVESDSTLGLPAGVLPPPAP